MQDEEAARFGQEPAPAAGRETWRAEHGASLVEYTLLLLFVVVVALTALTFIGGSTASTLSRSGSSLFGH